MKKKLLVFSLPLIFLLVFFGVKFWAQEACVEHSGAFSESFNTTNYRDPTSSVEHWGEGYITLSRLGANFDVDNPEHMPDWINTVTAADFDGDGWTDLVASSSSYSNVLVFIRNMGATGQIGTFTITQWIDGCTGNASGWPTRGVKGAALDTSGHCGITSGDYDGDGDIDFLFIASRDNPNDTPVSARFTPKRIWLYENKLKDTGTLSFTQIDKTSSWSNFIKGIAWSTTMIATCDIDKDGDPDIVMGNKTGQVILIRNRDRTRAMDASNKWQTSTILIPAISGWDRRGVSTVSVADFDTDGDLDLFLGSVATPDLRYYKNDGTGNFSLYKTYAEPAPVDVNNDLYDGAATVSIAEDFDQDGYPDLIIGTDNWMWPTFDGDGTGWGGRCFLLRNSKGDFQQHLLYNGQNATPQVYDFDLGISFDYDKDGDLDFLMADGNHTENYYIFINNLANVYALSGTALSTNITPALDPSLYAITKVQIKNLVQRVIGGSSEGLKVEYYVSNNNGLNWEHYITFEGADIYQMNTTLPEHTFSHYGSQLRWKALLTAPEDQMSEIKSASYETPEIDNLDMDYVYVDRKEYSRTSVAATAVDDSGNQVKMIIGGTFYFPGWQGHLIAYDVSNMTPINTSYSELRTVSRSDLTSPTGRDVVAPGVSIRWDAGRLLDTRSDSSRTIYTAVPGSGGSLERKNFESINSAELEDELGDPQGDAAGLIEFVRGKGRDWKLGDINHSNPVVVGAPEGSPILMGTGYDAFKNDPININRRKVLYVGANDGMLHCFDVLTGEELWGFIPYNLLPKLKNMWAVNLEDPSDRYFSRDVYVDGSPVVADVHIGGNWKTVLICGQGPGKGSIVGGEGQGNFYFALDITNPEDPQPLWELTDPKMGETWSAPAIGKVTKNGNPTWAAFMGSGYDNDNNPGVVIGNTFYAVDIATGTIFWSFEATDVDTTARFANIQNSLPGSAAIADIDQNGDVDRVYFPDLDGRIWKVDVSLRFENQGSWTAQALYTDPDNYPIITKPAIWLNTVGETAMPRIYFGTGGDDGAPKTASYSFVSLIDKGATSEVEWYLGPDSGIIRPAGSKDKGDLGSGEKVWADPKIEDYTVYFSTLTENIESANPCTNIAGVGKLYARFILAKSGSMIGGTAFKTISGTQESLNLAIKTRSAVTLGERQRTASGVQKREVYIQEYNSTIEKLEQLAGGLLKVKSWREVYKIVK